MKLLNDRGQITSKQPQHRYVNVEIAEWESIVRLRSLTAADREEIDDAIELKENGKEYDVRGRRVNYIIHSVVSESDAYIFTDDDSKWLQSQPEPIIAKLYDEIQKLNGVSPKELEKKEKN
jgi:hypothetical protein